MEEDVAKLQFSSEKLSEVSSDSNDAAKDEEAEHVQPMLRAFPEDSEVALAREADVVESRVNDLPPLMRPKVKTNV